MAITKTTYKPRSHKSEITAMRKSGKSITEVLEYIKKSNEVGTIFESVINQSNFCATNVEFYIGIAENVDRHMFEILAQKCPKDSLLSVDPTMCFKNGFPFHRGALSDFADDKYDKLYSSDGSSWRKYICAGWYFDMNRKHVSTNAIAKTIKKTNFCNGSVIVINTANWSSLQIINKLKFKKGLSIKSYRQNEYLVIKISK